MNCVVNTMTFEHVNFVAKISKESRENFWTKGIILSHLRKKNHGGLVAYCGQNMVGYVWYQEKDGCCRVWDLVVTCSHRRAGVGRQLMAELSKKFSNIRFNVRESNLSAQLFLKSVGFWCDSIYKNYFMDNIGVMVIIEDAYCFNCGSKLKGKKNESIRIICGSDPYAFKQGNCRSSRK